MKCREALGDPRVGGGGSQRGSVTWRLLLVSVAQPMVHFRATSPFALRNPGLFWEGCSGHSLQPSSLSPVAQAGWSDELDLEDWNSGEEVSRKVIGGGRRVC